MRTQDKNLTKLQKKIIDALANDYEDLEHIHELIDSAATNNQIKEAVWMLIEDGYVNCYAPNKGHLKVIVDPDHQRLDTYWYSLTAKGEQLLSTLEARN